MMTPFTLKPPTSPGYYLLRAIASAQAQAAKATIRHQIEVLGFLKHRSEQIVRLIDGLSSEGDFSEAYDVLSDYQQIAMADYLAEAAKLANLSPVAIREMARAVRKQADSLVDDQGAMTVA